MYCYDKTTPKKQVKEHRNMDCPKCGERIGFRDKAMWFIHDTSKWLYHEHCFKEVQSEFNKRNYQSLSPEFRADQIAQDEILKRRFVCANPECSYLELVDSQQNCPYCKEPLQNEFEIGRRLGREEYLGLMEIKSKVPRTEGTQIEQNPRSQDKQLRVLERRLRELMSQRDELQNRIEKWKNSTWTKVSMCLPGNDINISSMTMMQTTLMGFNTEIMTTQNEIARLQSQSQVISDGQFCRFCGKSIALGSIFCSNCGQKL